MKIDFETCPYNHAGRWSKKFESIMNPTDKVSWPQYIAEMTLYWRTRLMDNFKDIKKGEGWSKQISGVVRGLCQQAAVIANFFPHPDDEPLVIFATKKYFRQNRVLSLGGFRKYRTKDGKLTITQAEKDLVNGVWTVLEAAIKTRNIFENSMVDVQPKIEAKDIKFETKSITTTTNKKSSLQALVDLERELKTSKDEKNGEKTNS